MDTFEAISGATLLVIFALTLIYCYLIRTYSYWSKRGLNGPRPVPLFGTNIYKLFRPMALLDLKWSKKYGRLYGVYNKTEPMIKIAEPELIKSILVKDFHLFVDRKVRPIVHPILGKHLFNSRGDDWKRLRSIMSPTFTSGKMKRMYPMIRECLNEFLEHLEPYARNRQNINLKDMHGNYTMDVIATCAFATKTNAHKDPNNPFILNAKKIFNFSILRLLCVLLLPKCVTKLFGINSVLDSKANNFFIDLTRHIVRERKKDINNEKKYNDFIQLLVSAERNREDFRDVNDVNEAHHINEGEEELNIEKKTLSINAVNKQLTEDEIAAQGWLFFIAGYETTATTLTYCSYELALNPEVQDRLYDEIQSSVDSNGEISYEKLAKLEFLDSVLSETLRLFPPLLRLDRKVMSDYKLGNTGITLYKGQDIEIPVYGIHHSEEFYPNPEVFDPDRFMPENRHKIIPYTYLPFGAGPRNCIGMRFALMEAKLGLAQIVRRYKFFRTEQTSVPLQFNITNLLCSAKSVIVGIEKRV